MVTYAPGPMTRVGGHPILRFFASFPIACFSGALLTDAAYALTADIIWSDFSDWLLAAGAAMGVFAAIGGFVVLTRDPVLRRVGRHWLIAVGSVVTLALGILNNLVHSRDAWTSVMPEGIVLSALTVAVMLLTLAATRSRAVPAMAVAPVSGVLRS